MKRSESSVNMHYILWVIDIFHRYLSRDLLYQYFNLIGRRPSQNCSLGYARICINISIIASRCIKNTFEMWMLSVYSTASTNVISRWYYICRWLSTYNILYCEGRKFRLKICAHVVLFPVLKNKSRVKRVEQMKLNIEWTVKYHRSWNQWCRVIIILLAFSRLF